MTGQRRPLGLSILLTALLAAVGVVTGPPASQAVVGATLTEDVSAGTR